MTCGEVFENLEYDEEEVKELTESFVQEVHILKQIIKDPKDPEKVLTG